MSLSSPGPRTQASQESQDRTLSLMFDTLLEPIEDDVEIVLAIVSLNRYIIDKDVYALFGSAITVPSSGDADADYDLFDLVVTDGKYTRKCFLHPSMNHFAHKGYLTSNRLVQVSCMTWYDERIFGGGEGILVLQNLTISEETRHADFDVNSLTSSPRSAQKELIDLPLVGSRHYYIHIYNETNISGEKWGLLKDENERTSKPREEDEEDEEKEEEEEQEEKKRPSMQITNEELRRRLWIPSEDEEEEEEKKDGREAFRLLPLQRIIENHEKKGGGKKRGQYPFVARIIQTSKISHYAKPTDNGSLAKYPFKAEVTVAAQDNVQIKLVLWTGVCAKYMRYLKEGDLLLIDGYRIQPEYPNKQGPPWEISLNASGPHATLNTLTESQAVISPGVPLFKPRLCLFNRIANRLQRHELFDYMGVIVFAGRQERERRSAGEDGTTDNRLRFSHYRWIKLRDASIAGMHGNKENLDNGSGLLVKLFSNSQQFSKFESLGPGDVVLLSDLKLVPLYKGEGAEGSRFLRCRSTATTKIRTVVAYSFLKDQPELDIKAIKGWHPSAVKKTEDALSYFGHLNSLFLQKMEFVQDTSLIYPGEVVDTVYLHGASEPPSWFMETYPEVTLKPMREVSTLEEKLHHLERKTLLVQGYIVDIQGFTDSLVDKTVLFNDAPIETSESHVKVHGMDGEETKATERKEKEKLDEIETPVLNFNEFAMDGFTPIKKIRVSIQDLNKRTAISHVDIIVPLVPKSEEEKEEEEGKGKEKEGSKEKEDQSEKTKEGKRKRSPSADDDEENEDTGNKEGESGQRVLRSLFGYFEQKNCFSEDTAAALKKLEESKPEANKQDEEEANKNKQRRRGRPRKSVPKQEEEDSQQQQQPQSIEDVLNRIVELIKKERLVFLMEMYKRNPEGVEKEVTHMWPAKKD